MPPASDAPPSILSFSGSFLEWCADVGPIGAGRHLRNIEIDAASLDLINSIHSETTLGERIFLYNFMKHVWSGSDAVLEIGPFLGGTTRCLGAGMAANQFAKDRRLYTVDRFSRYGNPGTLIRDAATLVDTFADGDPEIHDEIRSGGWRKLFERVHCSAAYGGFLHIRQAGLPDRPGAGVSPMLVNIAREVGEIGVLFVDGCKSWYGTKVFMQTFIDNLKRGSYIILQDYGRYTCFWLTSFIHHYEDCFTLMSGISGTYTFLYRGGLSSGHIERTFPDQPQGWSRDSFEELYHRVIRNAFNAGDAISCVRLTLHLAAALATLGETDEARLLIDRLAGEPLASVVLQEVTGARHTPTWSPAGVIYL
jgi:hypothetical protein